MTPVVVHDKDNVPANVEEWVADDTFPVKWVDNGETVALEKDARSWAAASIARLDRDVLELDQQERSNE